MIPLDNSLEPEDRGAFIAKWKHIIKEHDKMLQSELDERNAQFQGRVIEVGDLVLIKDETAHKEQLKYYKEIFEVIRIEKARYYCAPLFKTVNGIGRTFEVNGNRLKPYNYSELFDVLPSKIRVLMGENLSPEQLKEQVEKFPGSLPMDLHDWRQFRPPNVINLRNRLSPPDKLSEPAVSIIETDILSSSDGSSSRLSLTESIPDHLSDVSSLMNKSAVSQIRTTPKGLVTRAFKISDGRSGAPQNLKETPKSNFIENLKPRPLTRLEKLQYQFMRENSQRNKPAPPETKPKAAEEVKPLKTELVTPDKIVDPVIKPIDNSIMELDKTANNETGDEMLIESLPDISVDGDNQPSSVTNVEPKLESDLTKLSGFEPATQGSPAKDLPAPGQDLSVAASPTADSLIGGFVDDLNKDLDRVLENALQDFDVTLTPPANKLKETKARPVPPDISMPTTPDNTPAKSPKSPKPPKSPKSPSRLVNSIADFGRKLRSRSKIVKPLRFRDPDFTT